MLPADTGLEEAEGFPLSNSRCCRSPEGKLPEGKGHWDTKLLPRRRILRRKWGSTVFIPQGPKSVKDLQGNMRKWVKNNKILMRTM
jgi:hypothetical protein